MDPRQSLLTLLLLTALGACAPPADTSADGPVDVPRCAAVETFGNGSSCDDGAGGVDLTACGGPSAACSPGRLCFAGAAILACSCVSHSDCAGRVAYVNAAREAIGLAAVDAQCVDGLCDGDVDSP